MSLYAYQLTPAQEKWFANNMDGFYQYAPSNLQKIFYLFSDSPLPALKVYNPSLEVTAEVTAMSFLLIGEGEAVHVLFSSGLIWRNLRAIGVTSIPTIRTDPRLTQGLSDSVENLKPLLVECPDITSTFFNESRSFNGGLFGFYH